MGLAEANQAGYREHGRLSLPQDCGQPHWRNSIISDGILITRDQDTVYAYDARGK